MTLPRRLSHSCVLRVQTVAALFAVVSLRALEGGPTGAGSRLLPQAPQTMYRERVPHLDAAGRVRLD